MGRSPEAKKRRAAQWHAQRAAARKLRVDAALEAARSETLVEPPEDPGDLCRRCYQRPHVPLHDMCRACRYYTRNEATS